LKILHLTDSFLPWRTGGKEVFVSNLVKSLSKQGIDNIIMVHSDGSERMKKGEYDYYGIKVIVLDPLVTEYINIWNREVKKAPGFYELLKTENPDIVHFHDQSGGASLTHLRLVKSLGIKTVLTYHSPGQSCPQRALLYKGKYPCDGKLIMPKCIRCLLSIKGIPGSFASLVSSINLKSDKFSSFKIFRVLGLKSLMQAYVDSFNEIYNLHDRIQVHAKWCKELLLLNNVPEEKIFITRQGILIENQELRVKSKELKVNNKVKEVKRLKLLYVGRCEWVKGVHVLIDAVKLLPEDLPIEIHLLGPYWATTKYGKKQLQRIEDDKRFIQPKLLSPGDIGLYMQDMDLCVVPSLWPETGPLVILESQRTGLPVIGSNFGGIAENIIDGENGILFERGDSKRLSEVIQNIVSNREILITMKNNIKPPRSIDNMADDLLGLYNSII
jgi:glycosyltransferase involved in cell wall biosynthesis